jgi:phosphoglycerate dehydrogenase-like enzyme
LGPKVLLENIKNKSQLKWVHSIMAGVDVYCKVPEFREADHIPLTNAKGAYSESLAEFAMLGVLYHTKHLERF